jgi:intracellular multiplication protein IcmJ
MRFLPLGLLPHPSAWATEPDEAGREELAEQVFERDHHACRFCGHRAARWQAVFHLDGDHDNWSRGNLVTACPLCHGAQHLGRRTVCDEMVLIWLPDVSQAALNCIVRRIHLVLHAHGEAPHLGQTPRSQTPRVHAALRAYHGLAAEAATVEDRIHTSNPRDLGAALLTLKPSERGQLPGALDGIRLLHRGRHFVRGRDVYPEILAAWS